MLSANGHETIERIESQLRKLRDGFASPFEIPASGLTYYPGSEAAVVQLAITWAALSVLPDVKTRISYDAAEASLRTLVQEPYAIAAILGKRNVKAISGEDITQKALIAVTAELTRDKKPLVPNVGYLNSSLVIASTALVPRFYEPLSRLAIDGARSERKQFFLGIINSALDTFYSQTRTAPADRDKSDLATILYELFGNAEEWGATTFGNRPVRNPMRGILLRVQPLADGLRSVEQNPINGYLRRLYSASKFRHALEVSVFDSGIGLAQRQLGRTIDQSESLLEELDAVQTCFARHRTSSGHSGRGLGLHYVMRAASIAGGFFRVRTGRLHLYRDFSEEPYVFERASEATTTPGIFSQYLREWNSQAVAVCASSATGRKYLPGNIVASSYAKGAAFTLLLPLKDAQRSLI